MEWNEWERKMAFNIFVFLRIGFYRIKILSTRGFFNAQATFEFSGYIQETGTDKEWKGKPPILTHSLRTLNMDKAHNLY